MGRLSRGRNSLHGLNCRTAIWWREDRRDQLSEREGEKETEKGRDSERKGKRERLRERSRERL